MSIFSIFKRKKPLSDFDETGINPILDKDYLGKAAAAGHAAKEAVTDKQYDKAWGLLHEQKSLYMQHANRGNWETKDVLTLEGSVSQAFANILRLEEKHDQAFVHILYWVVTSRKITKRQEQKLKAYFGRCKFQNLTLEEVEQFIANSKDRPDFVSIQSKVSEWKNNYG